MSTCCRVYHVRFKPSTCYFRLLRRRFLSRLNNSANLFPKSVFAGASLLQEVVFPKDQSFSCRATKTLSPQSMLIGPTDRFFSGNISRILSYKNNCETIPTYISCVSNSSELKFGLLFETFNQNLDDFPLYFVCIFVSLSTNFKSNFRMYWPFSHSLRIESCFYIFEVIA